MMISQNIFCSILLLFWCQLGSTKNLPDVNVDLPGDGGSQNLDLCTALKKNESSTIDTLLSQTDLNQTDALVNAICDMNDGTTPLFIAIEMQNLNAVELLLNKGADANHVSDDTNDKMIPLQWAIQRTVKDLSIFLAVLAKTSDINYQDSMGNTSLHYLVKRRPQYSNIMVQLIYIKGASDIENNEGKSAYDTAHDLEYVQMKEFVSWYANEANIDKKYGQFRKLAKTASEDLSKIQEYVNYIGLFPKFSYLATQDVQKAMAEYNTEENLEIHDQNIEIAQKHADNWTTTIYPGIKALYEDVGKFSTLFVQNYDEAESKIESLKQDYLTDEEFEFDIANFKLKMEDMEMDDSDIASYVQKYRKKKDKYRKLNTRKRNEFYTEIIVFLGYVHDYGISYEANAEKTLGQLQTFKRHLGEDKNNFINLKNYTEGINATSFAKWEQNKKKLNDSEASMQMYHEKVTQAVAKLKTFLEETHDEANVASKLTMASQSLSALGAISEATGDITDFAGMFIKDAPKNSDKKTKAEIERKRKTNSKITAGFKIGANIASTLGSVMDIYNTYKGMAKAQKEFDDQMTGLDGVDKSTEAYKNAFKMHQQFWAESKTFTMTISTQKKVMSKLDTLEEKITAAIDEVITIQAIWRNVTTGIKNMKVHAEFARKRVVDEDGQRWKQDNNTKLENKKGLWKSDDLWIFKPKDDDLIYIENTSKAKVLGATSDGKVILEDFEEGKAHQLWKKGELDAEDYLTLENSGVPKVLTAISESSLEIKGTDALSKDIEAGKKHFFTELRNMYTEWNDYVYKPLPGLCLIFGCQNDYITAEDIWTFGSDKAQRWKLDGPILKNKEGAWKSDDDWEFKPQINGLIYIENTSKTKVLGSTSDGKVIEEVKEVGKAEQVWKKGEPDAEGYFTLQNSGEPKVLTAISDSSLEIKEEEEKFTKAMMETIKRSVYENVNQNLIEYVKYDVDTTEVDTTEVPITPKEGLP